MTDVKAQVKLTSRDVAHVAKLAHLPLADKDVQKRTEELQSVLGYMSKIQSLNTDGVPEMLQVTPTDHTMREDITDESRAFTQAEALLNAPQSHEGFVMVPAIFEE